QQIIATCRRDEVSLAFRRQHDAVDVLRLAAEVMWCADMEALIRGARLNHLAGQDSDPGAIDLDLIVVAHHAARGRTAVSKIAARDLGLWRYQLLIEVGVPVVMAVTEVPLLGVRVRAQEDGSEQISHASLLSMDRIVQGGG